MKQTSFIYFIVVLCCSGTDQSWKNGLILSFASPFFIAYISSFVLETCLLFVAYQITSQLHPFPITISIEFFFCAFSVDRYFPTTTTTVSCVGGIRLHILMEMSCAILRSLVAVFFLLRSIYRYYASLGALWKPTLFSTVFFFYCNRMMEKEQRCITWGLAKDCSWDANRNAYASNSKCISKLWLYFEFLKLMRCFCEENFPSIDHKSD